MSLFTAAVKQFGWRPSLGHRVEPAARLGGRGRAAAFCCILRHVIPSQRRITHTSKTPHRDQQQGPSSRGSVKLPGWQLGRRGRGRFYLPGKKPQPVVVAIASRGLFLPHPAPSCLTRAHPQVHFYNFCQHKLIKKPTRKCRNCKIFFFFFLKKAGILSLASHRALFQTARMCKCPPSCAQCSHTLTTAPCTNLALARTSNLLGRLYGTYSFFCIHS